MLHFIALFQAGTYRKQWAHLQTFLYRSFLSAFTGVLAKDSILSRFPDSSFLKMFFFPLNHVLSLPPFAVDYFSMILAASAFARDNFAMKTYIKLPVSHLNLTDLLFESLKIMCTIILLFSLWGFSTLNFFFFSRNLELLVLLAQFKYAIKMRC